MQILGRIHFWGQSILALSFLSSHNPVRACSRPATVPGVGAADVHPDGSPPSNPGSLDSDGGKHGGELPTGSNTYLPDKREILREETTLKQDIPESKKSTKVCR